MALLFQTTSILVITCLCLPAAAVRSRSFFGTFETADSLMTARVTDPVEWSCSSEGIVTLQTAPSPSDDEGSVVMTTDIDLLILSEGPTGMVQAVSCDGEPTALPLSSNPAEFALPFLHDPADCVTQFLLSQPWAEAVVPTSQPLLALRRTCTPVNQTSGAEGPSNTANNNNNNTLFVPSLQLTLPTDPSGRTMAGSNVTWSLWSDNQPTSMADLIGITNSDGALFEGHAQWQLDPAANASLATTVRLNLNGPANTFLSGLLSITDVRTGNRSVPFSMRGVGSTPCRALGITIDPSFRQFVFTSSAREALELAASSGKGNYRSTSVLREIMKDEEDGMPSCLSAAWNALLLLFEESSRNPPRTSLSSLSETGVAFPLQRDVHTSLFLFHNHTLSLVVQSPVLGITFRATLKNRALEAEEQDLSLPSSLVVGRSYCGNFASTPSVEFSIVGAPVWTGTAWVVGLRTTVASENYDASCGLLDSHGPVQFQFQLMSNVAVPGENMPPISHTLYDVQLTNRTHRSNVCFLESMGTVGRSPWAEISYNTASDQFWMALPIGSFPLSRCA